MSDLPNDSYLEPIMQRLLEVGEEHKDFLYGIHFRCIEALALIEPAEQKKAWERVYAFIEEYRTR